MVEAEIIEVLSRFAKVVEREGIRVEKIILYGSRAAGKSSDEADIDVAVVSSDFGKDRFEEGVRLFRLAAGVDPRLEPVPVAFDSYMNDTWIPLIHEIRENGVEIIKPVFV